ncbi:MAG: FtsB family cell division protein [Dehalococcoidia bacterium]
MKQTSSAKKSSSSPVEPLIISKLQRTTAAEIARQQARAALRQRVSRLLITAVVAAAGLRVLTIAVQPCLAAYRSSRHSHTLRTQLLREAERHQHLKSQISYLQSDPGVEEEARKLGWTKSGEISLQLIAPAPKAMAKPGAQPPALVAAENTPIHISGSERVRLWLTRLLEHRM